MIRALFQFWRQALHQVHFKRAWFAALGIWLLVLVIFLAFWIPSAHREATLRESIQQEKETRLQAGRAQEEAVSYDRLSRLDDELEKKRVVPVTQARLIAEVTQLAAKEGLKLVSQDFEEDPKNRQVFHQTLILSGRYPALRQFLAETEKLPVLTVADQLRLDRENSGLVRATLLLVTYGGSGR